MVKKYFDHIRTRNGAIERNIGEDLIARARRRRKATFFWKKIAKPPKDKFKVIVKLPAPAYRRQAQGGACGALAGQGNSQHGKGSSILSITSSREPLNRPGDSILIEVNAVANLSDSSTE